MPFQYKLCLWLICGILIGLFLGSFHAFNLFRLTQDGVPIQADCVEIASWNPTTFAYQYEVKGKFYYGNAPRSILKIEEVGYPVTVTYLRSAPGISDWGTKNEIRSRLLSELEFIVATGFVLSSIIVWRLNRDLIKSAGLRQRRVSTVPFCRSN